MMLVQEIENESYSTFINLHILGGFMHRKEGCRVNAAPDMDKDAVPESMTTKSGVTALLS